MAEPVRVERLQADIDVRDEAAALTLLVQSHLRDIPARDAKNSFLTGTLERTGITLRATILVRDASGAVVHTVSASAPAGRLDTLAAELASNAAGKLGKPRPVTPVHASLGDLMPFVAAQAALTLQQPDEAAAALRAARDDLAVRVPAVRSVLQAVWQNPALPFEDRVRAALIGRDVPAVRALIAERQSADARKDKPDPIALAAAARVHLMLFDARSASQELGQARRSRAPFVRLTEAMAAVDDPRAMSKALEPLVGSRPFVPALVYIARLLPGTLDRKLERAAVAAAERIQGQLPWLAARVGARAARGGAAAGVDVEAALALVDGTWLGDEELGPLEPLIAEKARAGTALGLRLRAELGLRAGDMQAALADVRQALAQASGRAPADIRVERHLGRILTELGDHAGAASAWRTVVERKDSTYSDRRELALALARSGDRSGAEAALRPLANDPAAESAAVLERVRVITDTPANAAPAGTDPSAPRPAAVAPNDPAQAKQGSKQPGTAQVALEPGVDTDALTDPLAAALRRRLDSFAAIDSGAVSAVVLAPLAGQGEPVFWPYRSHAQAMDAGLTAALRAAGMRVVPAPAAVAVAEPLRLDDLAELASAQQADAVMLYRVAADGRKARVRLVLFKLDTREALSLDDTLPGTQLGLVSRNDLMFAVVGGLLAVIVVILAIRQFHPRGTIRVTLKHDKSASNYVCEVIVNRSDTAPRITDAEDFARTTKSKGHKQTRYRVRLARITTDLDDVPTGTWYVHVIGTYEKELALHVLRGELSRRVRVTQGSVAEVMFDLEPKFADCQIVVLDRNGRLEGAQVWLNDRRADQRLTTSNGEVPLLVPFGEHVVHVAVKGMEVVKELHVRDAKQRTIEVHVDREKQFTRGIALPSVPSGAAVPLVGPGEKAPAPVAAAAASAGAAGMMGAGAPGAGAMGAGAAGAAVASSAELALPNAMMPQVGSGELLLPHLGVESMIGEVGDGGLPRYRITEVLGQGAMGVVYRAHDRVLERDVALKVMRRDMRQYPSVIKLFHAEAKALAALNHPNIVTVYDKGQYQGESYIVMELIDGSTVEDILAKERRFSLARALEYTDQICAGLSYAHGRRILHRDIKPGNMFLTSSGIIKLGDFGLARVLQELKMGSSAEVRGTPYYMSPEQIRGTDIDFRADLYAVGCTLYEFLTGQPPFLEGEVMYHHVNTAPEPPSRRVAGIPPAVDALVLCSLEKDKEQRIGSAEELREQIARIQQSLRA